MNLTMGLRSVLISLTGAAAAQVVASGESLPNLFPFPNATGFVETYNTSGRPIDLSGAFFQSFGSNGRSCSSCHRPAQSWTISADEVKLRFFITQGKDPIFRTNDGSNCGDVVDTSTLHERRKAYSLLLDLGLFRIAVAVPANAEFDVISVANPYGCADPSTLSVYRRPPSYHQFEISERTDVGRA